MAEPHAEGRCRLLKRHEVYLQDEAAHIPAPRLPRRRPAAGQDAAPAEPRIDLQKGEDGTVQKVNVLCTCGRKITLECEYFGQGEDDGQQDV
jgi:hypothetical protein